MYLYHIPQNFMQKVSFYLIDDFLFQSLIFHWILIFYNKICYKLIWFYYKNILRKMKTLKLLYIQFINFKQLWINSAPLVWASLSTLCKPTCPHVGPASDMCHITWRLVAVSTHLPHSMRVMCYVLQPRGWLSLKFSSNDFALTYHGSRRLRLLLIHMSQTLSHIIPEFITQIQTYIDNSRY